MANSKHISEDEIKYIVDVESAKAQQEIRKLEKSTASLRSENKRRLDNMIKLEAQGKKETQTYKNLKQVYTQVSKQIRENTTQIANLTKGVKGCKCIKSICVYNGHQLLLLEKYTDKAQLIEAVADVDAMIVRSDKVTPEVLDAAKQLKIVVRAGAGYDSIDTAYAKEKGVVVENTPGQNANAVAELVFGLLVYAVRSFYNGKAGSELLGKKLGILAVKALKVYVFTTIEIGSFNE